MCGTALTSPNSVFFLVPDGAALRLHPARRPQVIPQYLVMTAVYLYLKQLHGLFYSEHRGHRSASLSQFALFPKTSARSFATAAYHLRSASCFSYKVLSTIPTGVFSSRQGHHVLLRTAAFCNYSRLSSNQGSENNFLLSFNSGSNQAVVLFQF